MPATVDHSESPASAYRAYLIGEDGRIETSTEIFAEDDDAAILQARHLAERHTVELWDRGRKLVTLMPLTPSQSA